MPSSTSDYWTGSFVYYGNYDADSDEIAEPVKYRVLDASTTDYSADGTTKTMLLDCDSILYYQKFDEDGKANTGYEKANQWAGSDVKASVSGNGFLNKEGVFTDAEKKAIAKSTKAQKSNTDGNGWHVFQYVELNGSILTINTLGTFVIKVSTPINGVYNKGEHTLNITVKKAASDLKELPVGTIKSSDDGKATYKVTTSDLTKGTVTYVAPTNKKVSTVTIPDKVKTIGKSAFYGCKSLKTVTIGKGVTKIGSKAFYGCSKLKTLTIKSTKLTTKKVGSKAFSKTPKSMTVKMPKKKLNTYKTMLIKRGVNKKAKFKKF